MKIIFFGTPEFVTRVLMGLVENFNVVGVVTAQDTIQGRKKLLTPSPVRTFATEKGITPIFTPVKLDEEIGEQLRSLSPDLFIVAAYGKIIPRHILEIPKHGALNIHPSLLPKYRGPSPIQTALVNGDKTTGITMIKMDEKMDHGPIVYQKEIPLAGSETFESLHNSLFQRAAALLPKVVDAYVSETISPQEQNHEEATYCHMITRESGYFDIDNPPSPHVLDRMIRAYYPWPTAWTRIRIKNHEARIMKFLPNDIVQLEGRLPISIKELLNGYPELRETIESLLFEGTK